MKPIFPPLRYKFLLSGIALLMLVITGNAQVSGTVFKDFNFNGTQQTSGFPTEPGVFGITVRAYNSTNALLGTKTTAVNGTYSFTAGEIPATTAVRIEFSAAGVFNAKNGTANSAVCNSRCRGNGQLRHCQPGLVFQYR
jgi:SdrD B-like domain